MKIVNKILLIILAASVVFTTGAYAQGSKAVQKKTVVTRAFETFPASLESNFPGIVESTIYNVILLKKYYPAENYSGFINKLNEIAEENTDPAIRFKAHLASIYLNFSELIDIQPVSKTFDREYLFRQITDQLANKLAVGY